MQIELEAHHRALETAIHLPSGRYLIPMPRVGSRSMVEWASWRGYRILPAQGVLAQPDLVYATFVRDPLERIVSAYRLTYLDGEPFWNLNGPLEEFIEAAATCPDIHVRAQAQLLPRPAFLGRFETLEQDWNRFCAWAEIPHSPLPHAHESRRPKPEVTAAHRARVRELWREDYEAYGYA